MENIYLYDNNNKLINTFVDNNDILINLYNKNFRIPDNSILEMNNLKIHKLDIIKNISKLEFDLYPLYDIETDAIYLINNNDLFKRVNENNYRFPDTMIIESLKYKLENYIKELDKELTEEDNYLVIIKLNKIKQSIEFLKNFDLDILKENFIKEFEKNNQSNYKNFTTCIRPSYANYIRPVYTNIQPNTYFIRPYYNLKELEASQIIYNDNYQNTEDMCLYNVMRDIHISNLILHHRHIMVNNGAGILQYYSIIGSYVINNYLRELSETSKYNNSILNDIIKHFWNIIITAPPFEDSFYIYRFVNDDSFLQNLNIGDIYCDKGFMSCTRDPYYISKYYNFGPNLMKIKVPKNKQGVGLCLELFSHFGMEQEVLLAPLTKLKLVKRDNKVLYQHTDYDINIKIKNKYEFEIVGISDIKIEPKIDIITNKIDKLINLSQDKSLDKAYEYLQENYLNKINQIKIKIGTEYKLITIDKINISEAYSDKVYFVGGEEIIFYYIENNEIVFFIEIVENHENNTREIYINLNNSSNYINQRIEDSFLIKDFLLFLKNIANYFDSEEVAISCDFISCEYFKDANELTKLVRDYRSILGGNFNYEIYSYFKYKKIRFGEFIKSGIIQPLFNYKNLDKYFNINTEDIIYLSESIEIKQVLESIQAVKNKKLSVKDFYIYLVENKCFLTSELNYILALNEQKDENIFYNPFYVFYPKEFN